MILKPSKSPLSAFILAEILDEIGLEKVFNLVTGHGSEIGEYLSAHSDIDGIFYRLYWSRLLLVMLLLIL